MTLPNRLTDAMRSFVALSPLDDLEPHDYATLEAAQAVMRDYLDREDRQRERTPKKAIPKRQKPKQDPPELRAGKLSVGIRAMGVCEAGTEVCTGEVEHTHHRKMRSAGGSHDPRNLLGVCHACHDYVHANPELSYEHGWLLHSWENEGREVTG